MLVSQQKLTAASVAVISLPSLNHLMKTPAVVLYVGKESLREKLNGCNAQSMLGSFTASMLNLFMRLATFWGTNQFGGNKNGRLSHLCMLQVVNNPLRCNHNWNFLHLMLKFEIGQNTEANVQLICCKGTFGPNYPFLATLGRRLSIAALHYNIYLGL